MLLLPQDRTLPRAKRGLACVVAINALRLSAQVEWTREWDTSHGLECDRMCWECALPPRVARAQRSHAAPGRAGHSVAKVRARHCSNNDSTDYNEYHNDNNVIPFDVYVYNIYTHIYTYMYLSLSLSIYIYIYIHRERERKREIIVQSHDNS